jgi:putative effector of murein hydrolase
MADMYIWIYFLTLAGYIIAGFIKGWDTAYLTAGIVFFGLPLLLLAVLIIFFLSWKGYCKEKSKKAFKKSSNQY